MSGRTVSSLPFSSLAPLPPGRDDFPVYTGDLYPAQLDRLFVLTTTLLVRRSTAGSALHFPEDLPYSEDWECFARLARAGPVVYLDCETAWQYDHGGPRMTDIALEDRDATQLRVLERVWGRDGEFLARHRKWYESVVRRLHLRRARSMIVRGRTAEARVELRLVGGAPLGYRLLAALPGAVARTLFALRRGFRRTP